MDTRPTAENQADAIPLDDGLDRVPGCAAFAGLLLIVGVLLIVLLGQWGRAAFRAIVGE